MMSHQSPSGVQRLIQKFCKPETWTKIEQTSRSWKFTCQHCRSESSIWEIGGIRYKAVGNPWKIVRCPKCGTKSRVQLYQRD